jgi:hypothetical protein
MQLPFSPLPQLIVIALIAAATVHDLTHLIGQALMPYFGWMFP